ncbi:prolyl 4-hydroxylase subunit alpha-2-like [Saccostrea echinata]|uniref:prolyl 4-hydroxylase subunit alpha-2-like n=1 Tax=Saccostrea echinata TaxID=191078 RepID=UPI002A81D340|nr:prolyl 4-hydroxylase subunit alpha-2-like [Saccostrea echinata]
MRTNYGILAFAFLIVCVYSEIYTSIQRLTALAEMESKLFQNFEAFIERAEAREATIPENVTRFYNERKKDLRLDDCLNMAHPIRAFYLVYRVYNDWGDVMNSLISNQTISTQTTVADFRSLYQSTVSKLGFWPVQDDVSGLADNVLRLWYTYDLDMKDILNGEVASVGTRPMRAAEIEALSNTAGLVRMYYHQMMLLLELYNTAEKETARSRLRSKISKTYFEILTKKISMLIVPTIAYTDFPRHRHHFQILRKAAKTNVTKDDVNDLLVPTTDFQKLCRGSLKTKKEESKLRCFLRETAIPFYFSKEEVVNVEPRVSLFHDVISGDDIFYLKREATKKLSQSLTSDGVNRIRISQTGWVRDPAHPKISRRLSRRISNTVNLDAIFSNRASPVEEWQVLSYTTGGHYGEHKDPLATEESIWEMTEEKQKVKTYFMRYQGQRIATWMFYLNDVQAGGVTVFPKLKARVPVVKGAAAFWYNLKPNGEIDQRMSHGGCPVILGSKWVCNKWIHESGQVLKRLCGKTYESEDFYPEKYV